MITEAFDNLSPAKINPQLAEGAPKIDACILTFSRVIEQFVTDNFACEQIATSYNATGNVPMYAFPFNGKRFAFLKLYEGAPACAAMIEEVFCNIDTDKIIMFGGSGCLNKGIAHGRVMVPTAAYRDEGTSYHYAPAADYITVKNSDKVAEFMEKSGIPYVLGKTWTTDAIFRETENNLAKRKAEGCISVEMEVAAAQAVCDFRGKEFYNFLTSGDLLDAPEWDVRRKEGELAGTQHDTGHFDIALLLADHVTG